MLPPAVAGIGLIAAFGSLGPARRPSTRSGRIAFTQIAVVLAVTFVASPFYLRPAVAAFEAVDPTLLDAARTLGAGRGRVFFRVMLPLAGGGLGAGAALAFARGLGEFGATIMFAGSLQGVTQTLSLAIYEQFDVDFDVALAISALLVVVSALVLLPSSSCPMALQRRFTHPLRSFVASAELTVERGETLALVGPSGAGKTTVLRAVAGLVRPADGSDQRSASDGVARHARGGVDLAAGGPTVGYVFQDYALFPHLTCERTFASAARRSGRTSCSSASASATSRSARPGELSGGERQRVGLARALAGTRRVLLLDEPLSALDAHTRAPCASSCASCSASSGCRRSLVTHDFEDAAVLADRVGVLIDGRVLQVGTPVELVATPADAFVASLHRRDLLAGPRRGHPGRADRGRARLRAHVVERGPRAVGRVERRRPPVGRARSAATSADDSALNHLSAPIDRRSSRSATASRVQVGPRRRRDHEPPPQSGWRSAPAHRHRHVQGDGDATVSQGDPNSRRQAQDTPSAGKARVAPPGCPGAGAEITPVEPDPVSTGEGSAHEDDTPNWGIEPVPDRLRVLGRLDTDAALGEPRRLAARARRRRVPRAGAVAAAGAGRDRRRRR